MLRHLLGRIRCLACQSEWSLDWQQGAVGPILFPPAIETKCYPKGTRSFDKNEPLGKDLYKASFKTRDFLEDARDEDSWGKHNYSCSKSEEDRRRFQKLRFGAECVTPRDLPKTIVVLKAKKVKSEKISVREFGYLSDATLVAKHNFGDFQVSQECNSRWRVWPQQRRQP